MPKVTNPTGHDAPYFPVPRGDGPLQVVIPPGDSYEVSAEQAANVPGHVLLVVVGK